MNKPTKGDLFEINNTRSRCVCVWKVGMRLTNDVDGDADDDDVDGCKISGRIYLHI